MSVLDQVVKNLIIVKADTSQAKAAIKELSGEEKKAAKERLEDLERQNSKLEIATKGWVKFAAGIAGAVAAYKLMSKAADAAVEDAKRSGTAGEGAVKAWTDATAKWKSSVDQLMVSFGKLVIQLAPLVDMMADLVSQIAAAVDMLNRPREAARDFITLGHAFGSTANTLVGGGKRSDARRILDMMAKLSGPNPLGLPDDYFTVEHMEKSRSLNQLFGAGLSKVQEGWGLLAEKLQPKKKGKQAAFSGIDADPISAYMDISKTMGAAGRDVVGALGQTYSDARKGVTLGEEDQTGLARLRATLEQAKRDVAEWQDEMAAMAQARRQSFLESIFGPLEQFNAYAAAFGLLQNSVTAAFDAWITGQSSIGEAVKAAVATGLRAVAIDASIQALKNTAYGVAALATGPIGGVSAGGFFQAAAMFGGVAVAAGVAAKSMYSAGWAGGGSVPSGGGGGGGGLGAGSFLGANDRGAGNGGNGQVVVMLGSDFGMLSTIEQKTLLRSAIQVGLQSSRGTKRVRRGS